MRMGLLFVLRFGFSTSDIDAVGAPPWQCLPRKDNIHADGFSLIFSTVLPPISRTISMRMGLLFVFRLGLSGIDAVGAPPWQCLPRRDNIHEDGFCFIIFHGSPPPFSLENRRKKRKI